MNRLMNVKEPFTWTNLVHAGRTLAGGERK